jgi:hypothetical protein
MGSIQMVAGSVDERNGLSCTLYEWPLSLFDIYLVPLICGADSVGLQASTRLRSGRVHSMLRASQAR